MMLSLGDLFADTQKTLLGLSHEFNEVHSQAQTMNHLAPSYSFSPSSPSSSSSSLSAPSASASSHLLSRLSALDLHLLSVIRNIILMENQLSMEGNGAWRSRVHSLKEEAGDLQGAVKRLSSSLQADPVRQQLYEGRGAAVRALNHNNIEKSMRAQESLLRSNALIGELQHMGASALSSLHTQRGHLKGAHRRALDVLNTLGLSSSLMRVIERKEGVNAAITYGCMVLTVCIVIFMYVYYR